MNETIQNDSSTLIFYVNGKKVEDSDIDPEWTLLKYLRVKLRLTGTKLGCAEGGCGACTVMVSKLRKDSGKIWHYAVNACLAPICSMHGLSVTTVEGIGSTETKLHPVQERLANSHGSQCGFCTPGFVMSMYTLLRNNPKPTMHETEEALIGNLCRCTGYRPILEGFRTFTTEEVERSEIPLRGCGRTDCCRFNVNINRTETCHGLQDNVDENFERNSVLFDSSHFKPYDPTQEVIFPPELYMNRSLCDKNLSFIGPQKIYYRPASLEQLLILKNMNPEAKVVIGNTEVGVEVKYKNQHYPMIIQPFDIPDLLEIRLDDSDVTIGAAVSFSEVELFLKDTVQKIPEHSAQVLTSILEMLRWFAGRQIRNVACFGGNIMTGSPISDINPILMAADALLLFKNKDSERQVVMDSSFYTSYRKNIAKPNEVLISITIPLTKKNEYFRAYKQSRRKDDDIAIVNAAMKISLNDNFEVESLNLAFGGMAPFTVMAKGTMKSLIGHTWNDLLLEEATTSLVQELKLSPSAPGGMINYRITLIASFFFKFYLFVRQELHILHPLDFAPLKEDENRLIRLHANLPTRSTQFFQNVPEGQERIDPVGRPVPHVSSLKQTTGEAIYIDDIPFYENELYAALVASTHAHALIVTIDASDIYKIEGVKAFYSAKDVPGINKTSCVGVDDEEFFASSQVHCVGEIVGLVVAQTQEIAQMASKSIKITYNDLPNPIFTINDAIEANSMWAPIIVENGDIVKGFEESDCTLEGESYLGGQEHFYLETNAHIAIPREGNEMEIICSSQAISWNQEAVAKALGISSNLVTCKVKRIGGGFGGKETRTSTISAVLAIAAAKLKRPVRIMLDRDEDMQITGGRHPFLGKWKVGFNQSGKIIALDIQLYSNAGYSLDLSNGVMFRAVFTVDNAYNLENVKVTGISCKTNLPSNTAFRGFGTPQACFIMEDIVSRISEFLGMNSRLIRERNFYSECNAITFYGQEIADSSNIHKCWNHVMTSGDYEKRKAQIEEFNRENRYKKRGISIIPSKYAVAFGLKVLNQAGVLVLVYKDGSVLISHGGMEMGQGIHTKMIQVASRILKVPMDNIYIAETSTDKVPNASPSAASSTADLNGMAIVNACEEILVRLKPYKEAMPNKQWKDWVLSAYLDRVSLAVSGFYKTANLQDYCPEKRKGRPFNYFTFGAALSEVEVDCLTGDHTVLRTDIAMDVGNSLNPAIDIGQIEGAYMQGYGLFTIEQLVYSQSGALLTKGPGAYKIPSVQDIPKEMNVSLLRGGKSGPRPIISSKALGEPPLFAAASVFFAIRDAVVSASQMDETNGHFEFVSPATAERIRMACHDVITKKIVSSGKPSQTSWSLDI